MLWEIVSSHRRTISARRQDYFFHCLQILMASPYKLPHPIVEEAILGWLPMTRGIVFNLATDANVSW